jgi:alpha-L-fucosidase 2
VSNQFDYENPEQRKIMEASLYVLMLRGTGEWMGWTFSEAAKLCLLMHRPAKANHLMKEFVDCFIHENTFDLEGSNYDSAFNMHETYGVTVEGDMMFADTLMFFACHSLKDTIYVFNSMPDSWQDVSFWHFRTEGAFLVSSERRNGQTQFISLISEKGGTAKIVSDLGVEVNVYCNGTPVACQIVNQRVVFDTKEGEEYIICSKYHEPESLNITIVDDIPDERNYFGVKKVNRY